jgi:hypothetical protein
MRVELIKLSFLTSKKMAIDYRWIFFGFWKYVKACFFSFNSNFFEFNFLCFFFPNLGAILEWLWSDKCRTFGHYATKLFARFIVEGYPFVTPLISKVIVYPFDFGLGMCWNLHWGWHWVELKDFFQVFLEVGNRSQLVVILGARLGWIHKIWLEIILGHIWDCFEEFWWREKM